MLLIRVQIKTIVDVVVVVFAMTKPHRTKVGIMYTTDYLQLLRVLVNKHFQIFRSQKSWNLDWKYVYEPWSQEAVKLSVKDCWKADSMTIDYANIYCKIELFPQLGTSCCKIKIQNLEVYQNKFDWNSTLLYLTLLYEHDLRGQPRMFANAKLNSFSHTEIGLMFQAEAGEYFLTDCKEKNQEVWMEYENMLKYIRVPCYLHTHIWTLGKVLWGKIQVNSGIYQSISQTKTLQLFHLTSQVLFRQVQTLWTALESFESQPLRYWDNRGTGEVRNSLSKKQVLLDW